MASISMGAAPSSSLDWKQPLIQWLPIVVGLLALYFPTFYDLANGLWNTEEQAHGPIILVVVLYLFWLERKVFLQPAIGACRPIMGGVILFVGLLFYILGRSQEILVFEVGSLIPILAGMLLATRGTNGLRTLWFAVIFCLFIIPLPGIIVDVATGPLKQQISIIAENVLYQWGYPIARSGVTIDIGPYQLLVADACSGLHSMFSLSALGTLYLYLMQHRNWLRNSVIIASILPIAFLANVVRVIVLILVTYHFGDEAGQGFIHGFAGIVLFVVALFFLFLLDSLLGKLKFFQDKTSIRKSEGN